MHKDNVFFYSFSFISLASELGSGGSCWGEVLAVGQSAPQMAALLSRQTDTELWTDPELSWVAAAVQGWQGTAMRLCPRIYPGPALVLELVLLIFVSTQGWWVLLCGLSVALLKMSTGHLHSLSAVEAGWGVSGNLSQGLVLVTGFL